MEHTKNTGTSKLLTIGSALLALAFLAAGGGKLAGSEQHIQGFQEFGLPIWMMYLVGLTEVVSAGLLLVARTRFFGAIALAGTMVGAVGIHIMAGHGTEMVPAAVLLLGVSAVAYATRDSLAALLAHLRPSAT